MDYDIIIIGSGPAGYVSAIRAGQLGMKVALIEKNRVGGLCLNWGCIPSKAMIESAKFYRRVVKDAAKFGIEGIDRKKISFNYTKAMNRANSIVKRLTKGIEFLLKKNNVEVIPTEAKILDEHNVSAGNRLLSTRYILIATGSTFKPITPEREYETSIQQFYEMEEMPERIVIYGYDAPSVEVAQMLAFIDRKVTLLVPNDTIMPLADDFLKDYALRLLKKEKVNVILGATRDKIKVEKGKITFADEFIEYDLLLNLSNRQATLPQMDIDLRMDGDFLWTNDNLQTSVDNIFAAGDVNGKSRFAHISSAEGLFVIKWISGVKKELDFTKFPLNMYTHPEMAQIGLTEQQIKEQGIDYKVSEFSLSANGKALAEGSNEGVVRILSETKYGEVLGVQIVADDATDMISEAAAYLQLESTIYDVASTVHAHPTISEAFMEAGLEAVDKAIHK